jgi:ketosteroid isomerase-like protein
MDDATAIAVMQRFGKAFFSRDPARLAEAVTEDAEWHFALGSDTPDGRVRRGVDGFLQGIAENEAMFEQLRFEDVVVRGIPGDQLIMTYRAEGRYREGTAAAPGANAAAAAGEAAPRPGGSRAFSLRGIELVTVREGRVAKKDVFWKQFRAD